MTRVTYCIKEFDISFPCQYPHDVMLVSHFGVILSFPCSLTVRYNLESFFMHFNMLKFLLLIFRQNNFNIYSGGVLETLAGSSDAGI